MFTQLNNHISTAVLDKHGRKIDEREFVNTPFAHLFSQEEFVIVDWLANSTAERSSEEELSQPITYNGKGWVRIAVCGVMEGQLPPQSSIYPDSMIGLVAVNADQTEKGAYFARIKKLSSGAWKCVVVRL